MEKINNDNFEDDIFMKSGVNAERILKRCHVHSYDDGGVFSFIIDGMGTGKTSVMLSFMDYTINLYYLQICFNNFFI